MIEPAIQTGETIWKLSDSRLRALRIRATLECVVLAIPVLLFFFSAPGRMFQRENGEPTILIPFIYALFVGAFFAIRLWIGLIGLRGTSTATEIVYDSGLIRSYCVNKLLVACPIANFTKYSHNGAELSMTRCHLCVWFGGDKVEIMFLTKNERSELEQGLGKYLAR